MKFDTTVCEHCGNDFGTVENLKKHDIESMRAGGCDKIKGEKKRMRL